LVLQVLQIENSTHFPFYRGKFSLHCKTLFSTLPAQSDTRTMEEAR